MSFFVFFHRNQKYRFGCKQDISDLKFGQESEKPQIIYTLGPGDKTVNFW